MPKNILRGDGTERLLVRPSYTMRRPPIPHTGEAYGLCPIVDSSSDRFRCDGPTIAPDFECADWATIETYAAGDPLGRDGELYEFVLSDDQDADHKPNCVYGYGHVAGGTVGSQHPLSQLVPGQAVPPDIRTDDFTIEMWMCELTPTTFLNFSATDITGIGYTDPPYGAGDYPGHWRITPAMRLNWIAGPGIVGQMWFGLAHHTDSFSLFFFEDETGVGVQTFWGPEILRAPVGEWIHYALVCERSNDVCRLYMNGTLVTELNIAGHRNSDVLTQTTISPHHYAASSGTMNGADRGVMGRTCNASPQFKWNGWAVHYEALTAQDVMRSVFGKTTQNKATTYIRYDFRDLKKGSYSLRPVHVRWKNSTYNSTINPAFSTADSYQDYRYGTKDGLGYSAPWACKEIRDLLGLFMWSTCCDSSIWGVGQGHAHVKSGSSFAYDQDPFWES